MLDALSPKETAMTRLLRSCFGLLTCVLLVLFVLTACSDQAGDEADGGAASAPGAGAIRMAVAFPTPVRLDPTAATTRAVPPTIDRLLLQITEGEPRRIIAPDSEAFFPCPEVAEEVLCDILPAIQEDRFTFTLADSPLERQFRLEAFEAGQSVPTFVGRTTAVIQGDTTLTIRMQQDVLVVVTPGALSSQEGETTTVDLDLSNPTEESPTCSVAGLPPALSIDPDTCQITGTLANTADDGSPYNVTITVSTSEDSDTTTFLWTISNPEPIAQGDTATTLEDTPVAIAVLANDDDPDGDALTVAEVTQGANGTVVINADDTVGYTPNADVHGTDTFTYTVRDADGATDTVTVTVDVTPVNDAPSFTAGSDQSVLEDAGPQSVPAWATAISPGPVDEAGQTVNFAISVNSNPGLFAAGPAISPTGTLTYTPAPDAHGMATLTVVLQDNGGTANGGADTSVAQTFTITVTSVNDAPELNALGDQTMNEGDSLMIALTATDPDGDKLGFDTEGLPMFCTLQDNGDGTGQLTCMPGFDDAGSFAVTVSVTDDGSPPLSDSETFMLTVVPAAMVEGSVIHFLSRAPIESAALVFLDDNQEIVGKTQTGSNGVYTLALPVGPIMGVASRDGFIPTTVDLEVVDDQITTVEVIPLVPDTGIPTGDTGGTIRNAITNEGVPGALIELRSGVNNTTDEIMSSTTTNAAGAYSFAGIQAGTYTASVSADGFFPNRFTVGVVGGDITNEQDGTMSPQLNPGEVRIILTWGTTPEDLDSHLTGPKPSGSSANQTCATDTSTRFHLYFPCAEASGDGSPFPNAFTLDRDDIDAVGPETVTILSPIEGTYRYCVHNYTNRDNTTDSRELSNSGAQVRVFIGELDGLRSESFNISPNILGTVWRVFELDGQTLDIMALNQFEFESNEYDVCNGL
jgi:hypothetical protein